LTVVDASAVIEMLLHTRLGILCADRLLQPGELLCSPHLIDVEVLQVLRRYQAQSELSEDRGGEALSDLADLPLQRYPHQPLLARIWQLRRSLSAYDAAYVSLAEALDSPLVTCDARLGRAHGHEARIEVLR
jgi:predicted nucleic acid-binding protein